MSATFSFPPLPENNFRYSPTLGGGALFDLGPYATSLGRLFFNNPPLHLSCQTCFDQMRNQVETGFSFTANYADDKFISGNFNFTGEYVNQINVSGPKLTIDIDRAFTTPPDYKNILKLHQDSSPATLVVPPADSFEIFLNHVVDAIVDSQHEPLLNDLLTDAKAREQLSNCNSRVTTL
jgi:predicted dehydrogenase